MKKLLIICATVMITASGFAQTEKKTSTTTSTTTTTEMKVAQEWYMMKDGKLMHYSGSNAQSQETEVTLKNGTLISTTGEVIRKDGTKETLGDNQCINSFGKIGDCEKMRAELKKNDNGVNNSDK